MRLGIISDTHDQLERTRQAVALLRAAGADCLIHCGDFTTPAIIAACTLRPSYFVFGNNDDDFPALSRAMQALGGVCLEWAGEITLTGKRMGVTHGHLHKDVRALLAAEPDYLFSGHSHIATDQREGKTRRINPGALYRAHEYTVALLDLDTDQLQFLTVPRSAGHDIP
jgi:putative phosphoesterase